MVAHAWQVMGTDAIALACHGKRDEPIAAA